MGASLRAHSSPLGPSETCCCSRLLLQIYSLNIEFYQLQATNTKTGRPAQWALATWAPEGPVSSA